MNFFSFSHPGRVCYTHPNALSLVERAAKPQSVRIKPFRLKAFGFRRNDVIMLWWKKNPELFSSASRGIITACKVRRFALAWPRRSTSRDRVFSRFPAQSFHYVPDGVPYVITTRAHDVRRGDNLWTIQPPPPKKKTTSSHEFRSRFFPFRRHVCLFQGRSWILESS